MQTICVETLKSDLLEQYRKSHPRKNGEMDAYEKEVVFLPLRCNGKMSSAGKYFFAQQKGVSNKSVTTPSRL